VLAFFGVASVAAFEARYGGVAAAGLARARLGEVRAARSMRDEFGGPMPAMVGVVSVAANLNGA